MVWPFFNGTRSYRRIIVPNSGGDLWWFAVVCGGLRWFVVICGGLSFSHTRDTGPVVVQTWLRPEPEGKHWGLGLIQSKQKSTARFQQALVTAGRWGSVH